MLCGSVLAAVLLPLPVLANPASVPLSSAFKETQKIEVSGSVDHYLDFTDTQYRIEKAFPSDPRQFRALLLSKNDNQQLVLKWLPNATAKKASVIIKLSGPGGDKSVTLLARRVGKVPDNIKTAFTPQATPQPKQEITAFTTDTPPTPRIDGPVHAGSTPDQGLIRPNWRQATPTSPQQPRTRPIQVRVPKSMASVPPSGHNHGPKVLQVNRTPKPVQRVAKVSTTGRPLIDRSTLDNKSLANYLIQGLHRARRLRQINRNHKYYWQAQSTARLLRRGVPVQTALKRSHLPEKTFNDLLGHGGVSR